MNLGDITGVGSVVEAVGKAADSLFTSDKERLDAANESRKLDIEAQRIDAGLLTGQQEINKVEAAHASIFVAGARPAVMWVCVAGLAYQYLLYPMLLWGWSLAQAFGYLNPVAVAPPALDLQDLLVILTGALGMSGYRTYERTKGVERNNIRPPKQAKSEPAPKAGDEIAP